MTQEYSCVDLLQASEAEQKEGMEQLKMAAKKYAAYKALNAAWQFDIGGVGGRTMTDRIDNFVLCKRVVVEHPDTEPAVEYPIQMEAEKNAKFLAEGDRICHHIEKAKDDAANQYPFQGRTFEPSHTFQPQLSQPSWMHSDEPW
jgi:hypothetical protein